ncbi:hypothetical protein [Streptomyces siamensis]|uniref:Uncharacterized protein n=1 Tax=Streptomyces siamensis TaxID=1274986 RepID=A0ABP9IIS9_9ACTN
MIELERQAVGVVGLDINRDEVVSGTNCAADENDPRPVEAQLSPPGRAGAHTTTVFMRLSAQHCDGLGTDPDANCLPDGDFQYTGDTPSTFFPRNTA